MSFRYFSVWLHFNLWLACNVIYIFLSFFLAVFLFSHPFCRRFYSTILTSRRWTVCSVEWNSFIKRRTDTFISIFFLLWFVRTISKSNHEFVININPYEIFIWMRFSHEKLQRNLKWARAREIISNNNEIMSFLGRFFFYRK